MGRFWVAVLVASTVLGLAGPSLAGDEDTSAAVVNYSAIETPFRMAKVNLVWEKARYILYRIGKTALEVPKFSIL